MSLKRKQAVSYDWQGKNWTWECWLSFEYINIKIKDVKCYLAHSSLKFFEEITNVLFQYTVNRMWTHTSRDWLRDPFLPAFTFVAKIWVHQFGIG